MHAWMGHTWFIGRKYVVSPLLVKPRRVRSKGRVYIQHIAYIPRSLAETLYQYAGKNVDEELPVITLIAPAKWYHVLNWKNEPLHAFKNLPREIALELEALGLSPSQSHVPLTVLAEAEELKELGIDPSKPLTLRELKEKIIEKSIRH